MICIDFSLCFTEPAIASSAFPLTDPFTDLTGLSFTSYLLISTLALIDFSMRLL
jgi:hypothetical protein